MAETFLKGSGGGAGGGGDFTQTPDNLRSVDTFEGLMGVAVGKLKGPADGLKSIRINDTAVLNETNEENFPGFLAIYSDGDPALHPQLVEMRLGAAAAPLAVNLTLTNENDGPGTATPGPWVTKTVTNVAPDYLDLRFIVQQLFRQDKRGIFNATATLEIQMKPVGATTWINPTVNDGSTWNDDVGGKTIGGIAGIFAQKFIDQAVANSKNFIINAKTTSPAVLEIRIWVPTEGDYENVSWDVRARLLQRETYDDDPDFEKRTISWESISAVYNDVIGEEEDWRGLAWLQFYGKASDNLSGVPEVSAIWDGKIVQVPNSTVWNAETRQYHGPIWDGSWANSWTNDPAWIIRDVIGDPISGLAKFAPGVTLNKWDALEASKWFSELVPDGDGGEEPRFSLNFAHNSPMKAEEFIRYLGGAVGALVWDDGNGEWRMRVDKPENPADLFTLENIEGEFTYSHTDVDTRHNEYSGTFLNKEFDYREETLKVFDNTSIALIGHKPTSVALIGCTGRQEAIRRLMLRLRSSTRETRIVNFTTNRRGRNLLPLDNILVADGDLGDVDARTTGRVVYISADRKHIKVRDPLRMELTVPYTLKFAKLNSGYDPDIAMEPTDPNWKLPTLVQSIDITNTNAQRGNITDIYLEEGLPLGLPEYLTVALEAAELSTLPKLYRIISLSNDDDEERVSISAVEVDTGKWDAADNATAQDAIFRDLRGVAPQPLPPITGELANLFATPADQGDNTTVILNWTRPLGSNVKGFKVTYTLNGGSEVILSENTPMTTIDLVNPTHGDYVFKVYTLTRTGGISIPLEDAITVDVSTISAAQIEYLNGQTIQQLQPAAAGADPTGANISAGITGQGDLATQDAATWGTQVTGAGKPEDNADVTSAITGPTTTTIKYDYTGVVEAGELPRDVVFKLFRNGIQITSGITWSVSNISGSNAATISGTGTGTLNITSLSTDSKKRIQAVYNGTTRVLDIDLIKQIGETPVGGAGGGNPGTTATDTSIASVNSASYGVAKAGPLTVKAGTAGTVTLTAPLIFSRITNGSSSAAGKWQWRVVGGSWADVATEIGSTTNADYFNGGDEPVQEDGSISVAMSKTGLTSGTDYEFQLLLRGNSTATLYFSGTASAAGS